jgi:hypothetical protein
VYSPIAGQRRVDGATDTRLAWTPTGVVLESWERVALPGASDTLHETYTWSVDARGVLTVLSEMETRMGRRSHKAVYRRATKGESK